ncbi:MAG: hypothetical protein QM572_19520 [Nocardioides sp.]|uniref:hypothetical protein n=1 Tax=Nocardioides sp. TaxID=35761 RepID=UPI0039E56025
MNINPNKIEPEQLARLFAGGRSAVDADELIDNINDVARELGAPWAFQRRLNLDGSPHNYRMHPGLYEITQDRPEILLELVEEAAR